MTQAPTAVTPPDQRSGARVELRDLTKRYPGVTAVDDVTLHVAPGEFVSLLGPSGSGKTTLLMMVAGFETPSAGEIMVDAEQLTTVPAHKRNIGMVFQSYALFPHMTVAANVAYPLTLRKVPRVTIRSRVERILDVVRLPAAAYARRYPRQLSGGQQQRVALARALVYEPRLLLMDEPMGALDKNLRSDLQDEIRSLHRRLGVTVLYVTHDQEEAITLSDRVAVFKDGRIEQIGTPQNVYSRPSNRFVAQFLGDANILRVTRHGTVWYFGDGAPAPLAGDRSTGPATHLLMIRPENTRICPSGSGYLSGKVAEVTYVGFASRVLLDTAIGPITCRADTEAVPDVGADVGVTWATHQMVVFDDSPASHAP